MKEARVASVAAVVLALPGATRSYAGYVFTTLNDPMASLSHGGTQITGISGNTVVGTYWDSQGLEHSFSETGGVYSPIADPLGPTVAYGISGSTIVGYYNGGGAVQGFTETGGFYTTITDPSAGSGGGTYVQGISGGTVVGYYLDSSAVYHGFTETGGVYTNIDDPLAATTVSAQSPEAGTLVYGISGNTVVGTYWTAIAGGGSLRNAFSETGGVYTNPDAGIAEGISGDVVVGWGPMFTNGMLGIEGIVNNAGVITFLNDPLAVGSPVETYPYGVDGTTVVGYYLDANGDNNGFIATLVPEPASLGVLILGVPILMRRRRPAFN